MLGYYGFHEVQLVRLVSASTWRKLRVYHRVFAARGIDLFHAVEADLGPRSRSSDAYFVHNLLPHAPYEVKEDCTPRPPSGLAKPAAYRAQIVCVHRHLGFLLDSVDRVFGPNRAIVIVNGDHGNREFGGRMSDGRVGSFGAAALNLAFASLLAVRYPGSTGVVHPEPVPLQDFLWAFVGSGFTVAPPGPWKHFVYGTAERDSLKRVIRPLDPSDMRWAPLEPARPGSGTGLGRD
jgi:hypothetical protein